MQVYGIVSVGMLLPSDILYIRIQTIRLICYKCMTVFLVHIVHLRVCAHVYIFLCVCVCVCVHVRVHVSVCVYMCTMSHAVCFAHMYILSVCVYYTVCLLYTCA